MDRWCEIHKTIVQDLHAELGGNLFALRLSLQGLADEQDRSKRLMQVEKLTQIVISTEKKLSVISDMLGTKS
jgi:signal transduction histidine kinase